MNEPCNMNVSQMRVNNPAFPLAISDAFVADILKPYRENARYLKWAEINHARTRPDQDDRGGVITGKGRFEIPQSCYIDDTGHFNAVEFIICYNQLAYVIFGKCIENGILQQFVPAWNEKVNLTLTDYKHHQLPSMLIAKVEGKFSRQLKSDNFWGELTVDRISSAGGAHFCFTSVSFSDWEGVKSKGTIVLAFSPAAG